MGKISAIENQKRHAGRKSIFVDGEFIAGVDDSVVLQLGLAVGQKFESGRLEEILEAENIAKAKQSVLRLLAYRDRTESEIKKRLALNGYTENIIKEVAEYFIGLGFLDDKKFSNDWVKARTASKPMGKNRLVAELRAKGVEAEAAVEAVSNLDFEAEYELAYNLTAKKIEKTGRKDISYKNSLTSFLARRGFSWDVINRVLKDLCADWENLDD